MQAQIRDREERGPWPGLMMAAVGLICGFFGLGRVTDVETLQGSLALEKEINVAFAHGGVKDARPKPPSLVPLLPGQPVPSPETLFAQTRATGNTPRFRIDTTAKDPCPT